MEGWKAAAHPGFHTVLPVLALMSFGWYHSLYHILSSDLIFPPFLAQRANSDFWSFFCTLQNFLQKALIVPDLPCFYHVTVLSSSALVFTHPFHFFTKPSPPPSLCSSSSEVTSLNLVLLLYQSYSFRVPASKSHHLLIHSPILGTLNTGSPGDSLDCFCCQQHPAGAEAVIPRRRWVGQKTMRLSSGLLFQILRWTPMATKCIWTNSMSMYNV